jgi:hypothetical protein
MRPTATAFAPAALVVPAGMLHPIPLWAVLVVVGPGVVLTAVQVIVTQIIRLRASARITSSRDALRVLEIEDLPHHRKPLDPQPGRGLPRRRNEQRRTVRSRGRVVEHQPAPAPRKRHPDETDRWRHLRETAREPQVGHDRHVTGNENLQAVDVESH